MDCQEWMQATFSKQQMHIQMSMCTKNDVKN